MNLFASLDSNLLVIGPGYPQALGGFNAKRGDTRPLAIAFCTGGIASDLAGDIIIKFGAKVQGDYDGKFVVSNWNGAAFASTKTGAGATALYTLNPSWNTTKLNWLLGFDPYGFAEVTDIETIGDVAGSLDGKYFVLHDQNGSVGVWFALNNGATAEPAGATGCTRAVKITTVNTNDSANTIATKIAAAFAADAQLTVAAFANLVTFTDKAIGVRTASADGTAATGFGFTVDIPGSVPNTLPKVPSVFLMGALQWTDPATGVINSVDTFTITVFASVINGQEGIATDATPAYPEPDAIIIKSFFCTSALGNGVDTVVVDFAALGLTAPPSQIIALSIGKHATGDANIYATYVEGSATDSAANFDLNAPTDNANRILHYLVIP